MPAVAAHSIRSRILKGVTIEANVEVAEVAAHSIRSRILKGERSRSHSPPHVRRSPFDPFEDTERSTASHRPMTNSCRSPFDPFEDTESAVGVVVRGDVERVAAHSIRSRILKAAAA